ncbi:MAG TPA: ATP-grasp fold amidoligase family protein [Candidatus Acidoferrum sp.]|nr:ATP-grasp fold amidoligase family protein [Candidatus Acidoferrum sp.]
MRWLVRGLAWRARRVLADAVPDRVVLARRFKRIFGRRLDLRNPQTLNEKLHWMMLYYRPPLMSQLADKYAVRPYVAERVGPHILNELYGAWDRVGDIDFSGLPDTFVLKVNWGWRMNLFCRDRATFDVEAARRQLAAWMRRSHYWHNREWVYKDITPRIVCERLLTDPVWSSPTEYAFHCFDGEPRFLRVTTDRASGKLGTDTFDLQWQKPPFVVNRADSGHITERPSNFDEMADCARRLSRGWPFVRVDFFGVEGRTIFQELSWHPAAGTSRFIPESYDRYWGDQLTLPPATA